MPAPPRPSFRFGPFELRTTPPVLLREGEPVGITPKAFLTLVALVSRQGEAVSKEELLATVWADTTVEESNLSQNIYTLRKLLAADFPDGNAIENIPRFGYRFTVPVREVSSTVSENAPGKPEMASKESAPPAHTEPAKLPGLESFVAPGGGSTHATETGPALASRLAKGNIKWLVAVSGLLLLAVLAWQWPLVSSIVGRQTPYEWAAFTANSYEDAVNAVALSPSGDLVAYADADGIVLRGAQETAIHSLPTPKLKIVDHLAWFPDQLHLVLSGQSAQTGDPQIWKISVLGEAPLLLRDQARSGTVSRSGTSIAFLSSDEAQVWTMGSTGENPRQVATSGAGQQFTVLLWALGDDGLLAERRTALLGTNAGADTPSTPLPSSNFALEHINLSGGNRTVVRNDLSVGDACLVGGNDLIYSRSTETEGQESDSLWRVHLDATTGAIKAAPTPLAKADDTEHIYGFSCSADGTRIAVLRKEGATNVFVADFASGPPRLTHIRRLSMDSKLAYPHGWSADGKSVLYESLRAVDHYDIFSQSLDRHDPDLIVSMTGSNMRPTPTPDGQWLLFLHNDVPRGKRTVYRLSTRNKFPEPLSSAGEITEFHCPLVHGDCVAMQRIEDGGANFFILDPQRGKGRLLLGASGKLRPILDWDVSPDGGSLVMDTASDVPLHVVSLDTGTISDVPFHSRRRTKAVNWTADGRGFFISSLTQSGDEVSFVDREGNATSLAATTVGTWSVPSPDGKHVAFIDRSLDSNVWLLNRK